MHERLKRIENTLLCAIECQVGALEEANAKELGEAVDMIKDLEEAIYYATITKAMKEDTHYEKSAEHSHKTHSDMPSKHHYTEEDSSDMFDHKEGRSHKHRKIYMEAREMNQDKTVHLRELEKYMQELSQDVIDMITEASSEEKQYLEKKLTTLASKVAQMKQ